MDDLTFGLRKLCQRNRDGSHATQGDRVRMLTLFARQLREAGFRQLPVTSLKGKHVDVLLKRWQAEGLSAGTLKNRLAHFRWWAEKIGKAGVIPKDNMELGVPERRFVTNENKAQQLDGRLDRITDPYVRMSLLLQQAFGLRREESIKFQPSYANRGDHIAIKGSWAKGGRARTIPITTLKQRAVLDQAHLIANSGSLIPPKRTYIEQRNIYDGQCKSAALSNMHGLRHHYAQARYEALTGWRAPAAGGARTRTLSSAQAELGLLARQTISRELGHQRTHIVSVYLGS